ncbi:hypothetical protein SH449x_003090 [Pirellulaceae bacterium SH449]
MIHQLSKDQLTKLLVEQQSPCVSLYMPTHRRHPENQQDRIRFRNLLQALDNTLEKMYPDHKLEDVLVELRKLSHDANFWNHRTDGLGILFAPGVYEQFDLQRPVEELLVIADSFHIKPLLRLLQATDRYQILGLNRHEAKLYEGNRDTLDEIEMGDGVPATVDEALGSELSEPHLTVASYGGSGGQAHGVPSMHHGHGHKKDEVDNDNERFFRAIDRSILEHHSQGAKLPLVLAALPEHHDLFHKVSHNPYLVAEGIKLDPQSISMERLCTEAWLVMEPHYQQQIASLVDSFHESQSRQLGASDLMDIAQALIVGRVGTLLVEGDRQVSGQLDTATGAIEFNNLNGSNVEDLLDDLAELTLRMGGDVTVIPTEQMPSTSGAAAIFRY